MELCSRSALQLVSHSCLSWFQSYFVWILHRLRVYTRPWLNVPLISWMFADWLPECLMPTLDLIRVGVNQNATPLQAQDPRQRLPGLHMEGGGGFPNLKFLGPKTLRSRWGSTPTVPCQTLQHLPPQQPRPRISLWSQSSFGAFNTHLLGIAWLGKIRCVFFKLLF